MNELTERSSRFYSFLENSFDVKWFEDIFLWAFFRQLTKNVTAKKKNVVSGGTMLGNEEISQATDDRTQFMGVVLLCTAKKCIFFVLHLFYFIALLFGSYALESIRWRFFLLPNLSTPRAQFSTGFSIFLLCISFLYSSWEIGRAISASTKAKKFANEPKSVIFFLWEKAFISTCLFRRYVAQKTRMDGGYTNWNGCAKRVLSSVNEGFVIDSTNCQWNTIR